MTIGTGIELPAKLAATSESTRASTAQLSPGADKRCVIQDLRIASDLPAIRPSEIRNRLNARQ
jgi:hypothetical protein